MIQTQLKSMLMVLFLCLPMQGVVAYDEGIDYALLEPAQPTANPNKIEVIEFFWYGCPHCFAFEPFLNKWLTGKADDVDFSRIPAGFNATWLLHAKTYYVAQELGILNKIHGSLFHAIHKQHRKLNTLQAIADFFAEHGVNKEKFYKTFNHSFYVHSQSQRSTIMPNRYHVTGVPTIIINGKYKLTGQMSGGSYDEMIKIMNFLIAKERKKIAPAKTETAQ